MNTSLTPEQIAQQKLEAKINGKKDEIDALRNSIENDNLPVRRCKTLEKLMEVKKHEFAQFLVKNSPHNTLLFNCNYCPNRPKGECSCG